MQAYEPMFPGQGSRSRPKMYLPKEGEQGKTITKDDNVIETQSSFYNEIDTEKDVSDLNPFLTNTCTIMLLIK